jgi:hypothetical protein
MITRIDLTSHMQDTGSSAEEARCMALWRTRVGQLSRVSIDSARPSRSPSTSVPEELYKILRRLWQLNIDKCNPVQISS